MPLSLFKERKQFSTQVPLNQGTEVFDAPVLSYHRIALGSKNGLKVIDFQNVKKV